MTETEIVVKGFGMTLLYESTNANIYVNVKDKKALKHFDCARLYKNEKKSIVSLNSWPSVRPSVPTLLSYNDQCMHLLMEYTGVDGIDQINNGTMNNGLSLSFVTQLFDVVNEIHSNGFVHGDIKPENMTHDGSRWFMVDFGFMSDKVATRSGPVKGTHPYIPPFFGNLGSERAFDKHNEGLNKKVAHDYYSFAMTFLSMRGHIKDTRVTNMIVDVNLKSIYHAYLHGSGVVKAAAAVVLSVVDTRYERMSWARKRCRFEIETKQEAPPLDVERDMAKCWAALGEYSMCRAHKKKR